MEKLKNTQTTDQMEWRPKFHILGFLQKCRIRLKEVRIKVMIHWEKQEKVLWDVYYPQRKHTALISLKNLIIFY